MSSSTAATVSPRRCECTAVIGGDGIVMSIAAASIIAKVTRDRLMCALAQDCPGYGFETHKGYAVPEHLEALDRLGPSVHHRSFFAPVVAAREKHHPSPIPPDLFSLAKIPDRRRDHPPRPGRPFGQLPRRHQRFIKHPGQMRPACRAGFSRISGV